MHPIHRRIGSPCRGPPVRCIDCVSTRTKDLEGRNVIDPLLTRRVRLAFVLVSRRVPIPDVSRPAPRYILSLEIAIITTRASIRVSLWQDITVVCRPAGRGAPTVSSQLVNIARD